jgi:hypothetical protein
MLNNVEKWKKCNNKENLLLSSVNNEKKYNCWEGEAISFCLKRNWRKRLKLIWIWGW